jgi:hypothetical protein
MQIYGQRYILDFLGIQGLMYLTAVVTYYVLLLDHPAGLWDEHSARNSGVVEGLGLMGVWIYSVVSRSISRYRAWKTVELDQVRAPGPHARAGAPASAGAAKDALHMRPKQTFEIQRLFPALIFRLEMRIDIVVLRGPFHIR